MKVGMLGDTVPRWKLLTFGPCQHIGRGPREGQKFDELPHFHHIWHNTMSLPGKSVKPTPN